MLHGGRRLAKLERVERDVRPKLRAALRTAQERVAAEIARAGRDKRTAVSERRRRQTFSAIGGYYDRLERELTAMIQDAAYQSASLFHAEAVEDIRAARGRVAQAVVKFDRRRVDAVWQVVAPENGERLAAVFTQRMGILQKRNLRQALVDVWRQSDLEGLTLAERHAALRARWDELAGDTLANRFVDSVGKAWDNDRYLDMLTRTTCARVARDTYFDTLVANGDDLAVIENVDGDACEACAAWDGVILSISGASRDYPSYQEAIDAGMFHPQCRCSAERVDETVDEAQITTQAETQTPDFERMEDEKPTAYRDRMTKAVAAYSRGFRGA